MIEYADYECPYCGTFEREVRPLLDEAFIKTGRLQLAFRHNPLDKIHRFATEAAEAAECAGRQDKFWEMHAALFRDQTHLARESLLSRARNLDLVEPQFSRCLDGEAAEQVRQDATGALAIGVTGTPAFLLGRRQPDGRIKIATVITGAKPFNEFKKEIEELSPHSARFGAFGWQAKSVLLATIIVAGIGVARARVRRRRLTDLAST
jgi:protein-disulfide isomerase